MKTVNLPTVDELNAIQKQWMELDSNGPKKEIDRVCNLFREKVPVSYVSVSQDKTIAKPMVEGATLWAKARPIAEAIKWLQDYHSSTGKPIRTDVAWCGAIGKWVNL